MTTDAPWGFERFLLGTPFFMEVNIFDKRKTLIFEQFYGEF